MHHIGDILAIAHQSVFNGLPVRMAKAHAGDQFLIVRDLQVPPHRFLIGNPGSLRAAAQANR